jgi:predicted porin
MSNSSRIGFKGSEDLGGGISVIWQTESTLNIDDGSGSLGNRNSFLGLSTGFGKVFLGKYDTPSKTNARKVDFFGDQVGDSRSIIRGRQFAAANIAFDGSPDLDQRRNNTINYQSPKFAGGLGINLQYVPDEDTEDDFDNDELSAAVFWDKGGLYVGADYQWKKDGTYELTPLDVQGILGDPNAGTDDEQAYGIAAGYKFGMGLRIGGYYRQVKNLGTVDGADMKYMAGAGASYTFGKNVVKVQAYGSDEDFDSSADLCGGLSCKTVTYAIGWDHNFSKQTTLQVAVAGSDNDDGVAATPWSGTGTDDLGGQAGASGNKPSAFQFNLVHKF